MDNIKIIGIYKITSISGGIYIGYTTDANRRWNVYYRNLRCKRQHIIYNSLKKYGSDNHSFEMIYTYNNESDVKLTSDEIISKLKQLEIAYIKELNSFCDDNREFGMNMTKGGDGACQLSEESRKKISESKRGIKQDPEVVARRVAKRTETYWNKSEEEKDKTNKKRSDSLKGRFTGKEHHAFGKKKSPEEIAKRQETVRNKSQEEKDVSIAKILETKRKNKEANPNKRHGTFGRKQSKESIKKRIESRLKTIALKKQLVDVVEEKNK